MRLLALALLVALVWPVASAATTPSNAASLLVYHVSPDPRAGAPDADPLSSPGATSPAGLAPGDTRIDGAVLADRAPEGRPDSALAHFREWTRLIALQRAAGASLALTLDAERREGELVARATIDAADGANSTPVFARFVLVEDGAPVTTMEGVRAHRYVARAALPPAPIEREAEARFPLAGFDPDARLGVVAILETAEGETLQSATWTGETITSEARMVLVERVTATWCDACAPGDEALALLASQVGLFDDASTGGGSYLRPATPLLALGLLGGAALGVALLRRRAA